MSDTAISWTHRPGTRGRSWNPVKGCSRVSEGCRHCYAERQAARIVRMSKGKPTVYDDLVRTVNGEPRWTGKAVLDLKALAEPLRWREPSTVFVNSMSDLFHETLTNEQIAAVFGVMAACRQHTFIVLTKRAKRMREWFAWVGLRKHTPFWSPMNLRTLDESRVQEIQDSASATSWPLPNVWLGVSVENQDAADERIPELLQTPAAVRLLSCEPLLGPLDLSAPCPPHARPFLRCPDRISWVIAGCESGPGARPCNVAWLRLLRDQCAAAGVPFFLKQARHRPYIEGVGVDPSDPITAGSGSYRKAGGVIECPYLDGVQHRAFPVAA